MLKKFAHKFVNSRLHQILENIQLGWAKYSFLFYIGSVSAILGGFFGYAGAVSLIIGLSFFYYAGKFEKHVASLKGE